MAEAPLDLAIIGAGAAGTYVAYHLAAAQPAWSIGLFERTNRVGGRLFTLPTGIDGSHVELGGMRFRTGHRLVSSAVSELGLTTRPFRTSHADNRLFLRGHSTRASDGAAAGAYAVDPSEVGLTPDQLFVRAIEAAVPGAPGLSEDEWLDVHSNGAFRGRALRDWTLTEIYRASLSEEAVRLLLASFGYASGVGPHNAADGIPYLLREAVPIDDQLTLADGMAALPQGLARAFEARGGHVHLDHALAAFEVVGSGTGAMVELRFEGGQAVRARRVVLALTRPAVEAIAPSTPLLRQPGLAALVGSTVAYRALKLYIWYDEPWWRADGFSGHRITTDLPLRKTFYLDALEGSETPGPALLLAAYADGSDLDAWTSVPSLAHVTTAAGHAAPQALLDETGQYLRQVHGLKSLPEPLGSAYRYWGSEHAQTAWHYWRAGIDSIDVRERITQPVPDVPVYLCGEAWSLAQAWIEGAFESAQAVVERLAEA